MIMTSISGFLKVDLYNEIEASLCLPIKSKEEISTCCSMFVELSLTQNELVHLLSFSIDMYCKYVSTKNLWVIEQFAKTIDDLLTFKCKTFNQRVRDEHFNILVSNLSMILLTYSKKASSELNLLQRVTNKVAKNPSKTSLLKEYSAEYEFDNRILLKYSKYFPNVDGCISNRLFRKVCALLYCTKTGIKEIDIVRIILCELLHPSPTFPLDEANDYLKIFPFPFPDLSHCHLKSSEIMWLLWLGAINFAKRHFKELYPQIRYLFKISQIGFTRKHYDTRIGILIHIFLYILPGKCFYALDVDMNEKFQKVSDQIPNLFHDIHDRVSGHKIAKIAKISNKGGHRVNKNKSEKHDDSYENVNESVNQNDNENVNESDSGSDDDSMCDECIPSYMNVIPTRPDLQR